MNINSPHMKDKSFKQPKPGSLYSALGYAEFELFLIVGPNITLNSVMKGYYSICFNGIQSMALPVDFTSPVDVKKVKL